MENKPFRLFIASSIPFHLSSWVSDTYEKLKKIDCDISWVRPENCHMTFKFLGDTAPENVTAIKDSLRDLPNLNIIQTRATEVGAFPRLDRPEIVWVGLEDTQKKVMQLSRDIEDSMEKLGFPKDEHEFKPHMTIARIRTGRNKKTFVQAIKNIKNVPQDPFTLREIILYKSTQTQQGPLYTALESFPLK